MKRSLSVLFACLPLFLSANDARYSYFELRPEEGYPSKVSSFCIEQMGFAWLGSDEGLYHLTGNRTFLKYDEDDSESELPGSEIISIFKDEMETVWVLTNKGFAGYPHVYEYGPTSRIAGIDGETVVYSATSDGRNVYFGGINKVWKYSYDTGEFSLFQEFLTNDDFHIDGLLLMNGRRGKSLALFSRGVDSLIEIDLSTGNVRKDFMPSENRYMAAFIDSKGLIWMSEYNNGVSCYEDGRLVVSYDTDNSDISSNIVLCFAERNGKIWMGTVGGGISILDPATGQFEQLAYKENDPLSLPALTVISIFCDHNGHVWCGRPAGGAFIISETQIESMSIGDIGLGISPEGFSVFYHDNQEDVIWMGTFGSGLFSFDPETGSYTHYPTTAGLFIYGIARLDEERIVLSCPGSETLVFDRKTGAIRSSKERIAVSLRYTDRLVGSSVTNDADGRVLFASTSIQRWDNRLGRLETISFRNGVVNGRLQFVYGSEGRYLIDDTHLFEWDESGPDKLKVLFELSYQDKFNCATMGMDDVIWLSADKEVLKYDLSNDEIQSETYSFKSKPNCLACDRTGRLWIGTLDELCVLDPVAGSRVPLGPLDGVMMNEYSEWAKITTSDGDIFLGGRSGIVHIKPDFHLPKARIPQIVAYSFLVDHHPFSPVKPVVPFIHSNVDIRFFARSQDITRTSFYRFRVESHGQLVSEFETTDPNLHYNRLSPGHYTVSVSCTSPDGVFSPMEQIISFDVAGAWYRQWWFFTLVSLCLAGLLAGIIIFSNYRKRMRREVEYLKEVERNNFLFNVSLELRTPLTLIIGPLRRLLRNKTLTENDARTVKSVCHQANHISDLLDTVLTTNKLQDGNSSVQTQPVSLGRWVRRVVDDFKEEMSGHDMDINVEHDTNVGYVPMDEHLCRIVFSNILSNAMKHNQAGHEINVRSELKEKEGMVRISVSDHGSGVGDINVSSLFDGSRQINEGGNSGFGLGLSYSKKIVEAHNGRMGAYNNKDDQGATFWFELPCNEDSIRRKGRSRTAAPAMSEEPAPPQSVVSTGIPEQKETTRQPQRRDLRKMTVLFVDDDADLRLYVADELGEVCGRTLTAVNGNDALKVLSENDVDLVITDVMMPEMDGLELCQMMKGNSKLEHVKVIMLTARADETSRRRGYQAKADYYLPKPFNIDELVSLMQTV